MTPAAPATAEQPIVNGNGRTGITSGVDTSAVWRKCAAIVVQRQLSQRGHSAILCGSLQVSLSGALAPSVCVQQHRAGLHVVQSARWPQLTAAVDSMQEMSAVQMSLPSKKYPQIA